MMGPFLFWLGFLVVCLSYVGYALWAWSLARLRPIPSGACYLPDQQLPSVTCVMVAANEAPRIGSKLDALVQQDYPRNRLAVIVVNDASTDDTMRIAAEWASRDPRIRVLRTPSRSGKPTALNLARRYIESEVAVLMDVRQGLTPGAIRELVAHLVDPEVGVVSGDIRIKGDRYWTYERFVRRCESRSGSMVQVTGSLYAIRSRDLPEIPPETILDDVYVPLTVALTGRRIVMAERAGSLDVATRSVSSEFIRKVRTLAGLVQICHTVKGCLNPRRNPLWGRLVAHKLSRLVCPYGLLLMLAGSVMAPGVIYRLALAAAAMIGVLALGGRLGLRSGVASLTQSVLALNVAALWAVPSYYLGYASVTWKRIEADRT